MNANNNILYILHTLLVDSTRPDRISIFATILLIVIVALSARLILTTIIFVLIFR